ncbi:MAG TPA: hypothetical protein VFG52_01665, partial [Xanthomonadales bacterium]|nr:hypothetical protein [Xanthomonadales bacterium]
MIAENAMMKRTSSAIVLLGSLAMMASYVQAQDQDIVSRKTPPLGSLAGFATEVPAIQPGAIAITPIESQRLSHSRLGDRVLLPSIDQYMEPEKTPGDEPLQFRRVEMFAPGARVVVLGPTGAVEWQQDARQFYVASNSTTGVGLAVDTASGEISGFAVKGNSRLQLDGQLGVGIELQAIESAPDENNSCATNLGDQPAHALQHLNNPTPASASAAASGSSLSYQTIIA